MNTGIISTRYATALLKYTQETGNGEKVCAQMQQLLKTQDLKSVVLEPELERFVALLVENGRMEDVRFIFNTFVGMYYESQGICLAQLTMAAESPELEGRLHKLLEQQFGCRVKIETTVDPSLIGGFVIHIDGKVLDASIKRQIDSLRRQFVIQNNRIV